LEQKDRILKHSEGLFFSHGFSNITLSQIAAELGIGKATIYKYFLSKEAILDQIIDSIFQDINDSIDEIENNSDFSYKDKFRCYLFLFAEKYFIIQNRQIVDIKKSAPNIWEKVEKYEKEIFNNRIKKLIFEGMAANLLKGDFEIEFLVDMILNSLQKMLTSDIKSRLSISYKELIDNIIKIYFEGILN